MIVSIENGKTERGSEGGSSWFTNWNLSRWCAAERHAHTHANAIWSYAPSPCVIYLNLCFSFLPSFLSFCLPVSFTLAFFLSCLLSLFPSPLQYDFTRIAHTALTLLLNIFLYLVVHSDGHGNISSVTFWSEEPRAGFLEEAPNLTFSLLITFSFCALLETAEVFVCIPAVCVMVMPFSLRVGSSCWPVDLRSCLALWWRFQQLCVQFVKWFIAFSWF